MNERPAPSALYDWAMTIASLWLAGGIMIDAFHHFHSTVETFFEPAHALLYAGLLVSYVFTGIALWHYRRQGFSLRNALPKGYETTLAGLVVFLVGGIGDMIKHTLWGFEQGFDALGSPTHLLIGAGMFLIIAGPVRSAIERSQLPRTLLGQLPMLLAAASLMELLHWGTQFIFLSEAERMNAPLVPTNYPHDVLTLITIQYMKQAIAFLSVIVQSLLMAGFALYLARRIRLAPGALVVLFLAGNGFIAAAHSNYAGQFAAVMLASFVAGAIGDAFRVDPAHQCARHWNAFAALVPAGYWVVLLAVLAITMGGIWWSPDVICGTIIFAALAGLFANALCGPFERERDGLVTR